MCLYHVRLLRARVPGPAAGPTVQMDFILLVPLLMCVRLGIVDHPTCDILGPALCMNVCIVRIRTIVNLPLC